MTLCPPRLNDPRTPTRSFERVSDSVSPPPPPPPPVNNPKTTRKWRQVDQSENEKLVRCGKNGSFLTSRHSSKSILCRSWQPWERNRQNAIQIYNRADGAGNRSRGLLTLQSAWNPASVNCEHWAASRVLWVKMSNSLLSVTRINTSALRKQVRTYTRTLDGTSRIARNHTFNYCSLISYYAPTKNSNIEQTKERTNQRTDGRTNK